LRKAFLFARVLPQGGGIYKSVLAAGIGKVADGWAGGKPAGKSSVRQHFGKDFFHGAVGAGISHNALIVFRQARVHHARRGKRTNPLGIAAVKDSRQMVHLVANVVFKHQIRLV
jgi:hypothetical protein